MKVFGFIFVAIIAGIPTRSCSVGPGSASTCAPPAGRESAAVASGVNVKRMVVYSLLISGAVAGLVGMPQLLGGSTRSYSLDFPAGLGFTGIAIALLGRNNASAWRSARCSSRSSTRRRSSCDLDGISKEIVLIMQGTIVLSVVVVYELVRRYGVAPSNAGSSSQLADEHRRDPDGGAGMSTSTVARLPPGSAPRACAVGCRRPDAAGDWSRSPAWSSC